jgi:hypothetical protein
MKRALSILLFFHFLNSEACFAWTLASAGVGGWPSSNIEVQYDFSRCASPESDLLGALDQAVEVWNAVEGSSLRLTRAKFPVFTTSQEFAQGRTARTPIVFCDPSFQSGQSLNADSIPAATRTGSRAGRLAYSGVILNAESRSGANVDHLEAKKLAIVLAHELGHALGLGHSEDISALMYFSLEPRNELALSQDDQDGIRFLYARNELMGGPFGCASATPQGSRGFAWLGFFVFFGVLAGRFWLGLRTTSMGFRCPSTLRPKN